MKLKKFNIKNFRGYNDVEILFDDNMNVIIGRNDVGKSTIMDALEIFLNGDNRDAQVKMEINDLNVSCKEDVKEIRIACCFDVRSEEILIDTTNPTNLTDEYLLNEEGLLEISKVWNCNKTKISAADLKVYISANYPSIFDKPLVQLKIQDLRNKLEEFKDNIDNYDAVNKSKSADIRKALYNNLINEDTEFSKMDIDITKEDAKNIWDSIKNNLPLFFLFKSDRANTDGDSEVQNPLKIATKNALANVEEMLNEIKANVEKEVKKIGESTIRKLHDLDPDIAKDLRTELKLKPWESIFSFDLIDDIGIPLNKRGSGIRRLMLLSYFRAEAERISENTISKDIIYAIEEPETSQHPDYQKMIVESLIEISNDDRHQIILTTHTPEIAKMVDINQLIFIKKGEDRIPIIIKDEEVKIKNVIETLGILPTITSKLVICVEGENDISFLKNINRNIEEYREIIDLDKEDINIIPLIGSNLLKWVNANYLKGSNVKEVHIYDGDIEDYKLKIEEINISNDGRRFGWVTKRREMENYINPNLIERELSITLDDCKQNWNEIDVPKTLVGRSLQNINDKDEREKVIKKRLNNSIAKKIKKEDLCEIEVFDELKGWFIEIKRIYEL